MKDYIKIGIDKVLFSLNEDRSRITYVYQKKERNVVKCVRKSAMLYFVGFTGQQCVSSSDLKNFDLAFPPKEKQKEIATHVYELRLRTNTLQEEGKCLLEEMKHEI